ncbi:acyl-ACP--UDP-N-acetylglucosamine O-acyltransferase [Helicobacter canadensis]|uniref:Acyl-[acyl-carrier-protein]--UDP-N-acetylglucosamine O-acyltransferase n=1 Tax=Helicobacter canadensis MIT 98-5491 TaxID=537970 RepID=C5ZVQ9_9HELI|nr:acyl-ACP--UDP-N-acetylglucosamine O-acyltransferase [Helicobacter canadensis]EES88963.1 UDP-N-acetylglucosamine acyltransferase [Helicobacter canadensis MIT 98-5491]EFR48726.1 acyl-[acyl-carrier-protein]-UDP-N-acetylglucosamine O-acyltransferase [Helicobacter canadensis MIT 98-5491]STP00233.1 UDP-N-acetylglucosamine acyltransferase [Helicobacter canadensis]
MNIAKTAKIAPSAIIEEGAIIGENVEIGHYCIIGKNVKIGDNSKLYNHVTILGNTTLGKSNTIFPNATLGTEPQDLKYHGEPNELIFGDNNKIREFTMINPGTEGGGSKTIIGSNNLLMAYVHVAHDCTIGNHCILANGATLGGHIVMGDYINIGGLTPIHQFVKIGDYAMIAGASALSQDIPPFCMAEGNRAVIRGLNLHRLRKNFEHYQVDKIHSTYKRLFFGNQPIKEIAQEILDENPNDENVTKMCHFILNSTRGIPFIRKSL